MAALEQVRRLPRSLAPLFAGTIATRLGTFVVPYLTIYLSQGRGFSLAATGQIIAAGGVGLLVGNLLGGQLADHLSRRTTLIAALVVNAIGVAVLSLALLSVHAYAIALGLALVGAGMYPPAANALIADLTTEAQRPLAYAVSYLCINVGMGLGPLLGGVLAASGYGWLFFGDIATTIVCAALIAVGVPATQVAAAGAQPRDGSTLRVWARHPKVVAFCGASIFIVAPLMALEYAVPILVRTTFDRALVYVGLVYSINAACIMVFSLPIERAVRRRNEAAMMSVAAMLWASGLGILALGFSISALLACTVVWTLGEIVGSVVIPTYISRRVAPSAKGRMLSLQDAVRSVSAIACPIALGAIWDGAGVGVVLAVLVAIPILGGVVYTAWWRRGLRIVDPLAPLAVASR